jgi:heavy metal sensor kinase
MFTPKSVHVRLTLWYACALASILAAFSIAVYLLVRASLLHEVGERAEQSAALIQRLVVDNPDEADEIEEHGIVDLFAVLRPGARSYTSTAWSRQGLPDPASLTATSSSFATGSHASDGLAPSRAADPSLVRWQSDSGAAYAIASIVSAADPSLAVSAAVDEGPVLDHLSTLRLVLILGYPLAIAASVIGGSLLAKRLLRPVGAMADAANRINADRLSERLPIGDPADEFGRLARAFNDTLARLETAFERLRRFTADASHELRTPLTALRSVGEVALHAPDFRDRAGDTVASMLEECERLTQLVDGLLMLTRESTEAYRARFALIDMGALCLEVVELLRVVSEEKDQRLLADLASGLTVRGDRTTLRQALVNLVDNAIKYTSRGKSVRVRARAEAGEVIVEVSDDGPGIAAEHRERVFDRFYRIDDARSRASGGAGLGLAIARWAVELNGGRLVLESTLGTGSTFRAHLPSARSPNN